MKFEVTSMAKLMEDIPMAAAELFDSAVKDKFYVGALDGKGTDYYLRNDCRVFRCMQDGPLDLDGGTYFSSQQDAEDCLNRYNLKIKQTESN